MLRLVKISKSFQADGPPLINKLSLELKTGEFTVLIGGNGSGKSTLLKLIQGEHAADEGEVFLDGRPVVHEGLAQRAEFISTVSQDVHSGTVKELTLLENMVLSLKRGLTASFEPVSKHRDFCIEKLKELGLGFEKFLDTPLMHLSGGQKQTLALLMATIRKPDLLLLDEPCSALDPKTSKHLMAYIDRVVREAQLTTLMVTHSLPDALEYGDRLIMLKDGRIIVDAKGEKKRALHVSTLLEYYHHFEDSSLL